MRTFLAGADLVLADRIARGATVVIEGAHIVDIVPRVSTGSGRDATIRLDGHIVIPGLVDVHVHGIAGHDALDGPGSITAIAAALPRAGVTAFCPTTVACAPAALDAALAEVAAIRAADDASRAMSPAPGNAPPRARVLGAHLETNFINPEYRGAQPVGYLCSARGAAVEGRAFSAAEVLAIIDRHRSHIAVLTLAPEIEGGLDLVRTLMNDGHRVSLGHSGATAEEADAAFALGASRATHLFNRMSPMTSRAPGLVGAALARDGVVVELIGDGHHVHPTVMKTAIAAKGVSNVMAISDGTAGCHLPPGAHASLGGRRLRVGGDVARLDDGTMAGSVTTMDAVLRCLVQTLGASMVDAVTMCARTPARVTGDPDGGMIAVGGRADLVVLSPSLDVRQTWIAGRPAASR